MDHSNINRIFQTRENTLSTLDNSRKEWNGKENNYEYYMKIIPTKYRDINQNEFPVYQMSATEHHYVSSHKVPGISFRFDISPIYVVYEQYKRQHFHFFVSLCAIVGGVFTVIGMLDSLLYKCCD